MRLDVIFADIDGFMSDDGLHRPTVEMMNEFAPQHSRLFKEACHSFIHSQFSPSGGGIGAPCVWSGANSLDLNLQHR